MSNKPSNFKKVPTIQTSEQQQNARVEEAMREIRYMKAQAITAASGVAKKEEQLFSLADQILYWIYSPIKKPSVGKENSTKEEAAEKAG
jgi:hypothetical protein